ncbi:MAG: DUF21 domain-containing protein, partial [Bacteroidota bacterium]
MIDYNVFLGLIIILCLILSAFFSGMEIAFVSANHVFVELERKKDNLVSKTLSKFYDNRSRFLATMLVGNNAALVVYAFYMGELLMPHLQHWLIPVIPIESEFSEIIATIVQTVASTVVVLITAEFLPKSIFLLNPEVFVRVMAIPMRVIWTLLKFPVQFVVFLSKKIMSSLWIIPKINL